MEKVTANQFANNALWRFIDVISRKAVSLVISIILARLIAPEAYGVVALTTVFITFSDIFILNGFNIALIRKEKISEIDYSTVTTMSLVFTAFMYVAFFVSAPYIGIFYESEDLCPVLRSITVLLFFESVSSVIRAKATRELQFKKMAFTSFISNVGSGLVALVFAYKGYGVWALVIQQVLANLLDMIMLMLVFRWRVSLKYSSASAKSMTKFTIGVLGTSFLDFLGNNVCSLIVGKSYSTKQLGYYNRANMFPETIGLNAYNSINSVLLPTLASRQDDAADMKNVTRKVMSFTMYIIVPLMVGLMAVSENLIVVLLTEKWLPVVPMMYFCCVYYAVNPVRAMGYSILYAKGESKETVKVELVRATLMIAGILIVVLFLKRGILSVLTSNLIVSIVVLLVTQRRVKKCISYSFTELLQDIMPAIIISAIMFGIVRLVGLLAFNQCVLLFLQILAGVSTYIVISFFTKNKNFRLVIELVHHYLGRR